jgi:hypothetical protein
MTATRNPDSRPENPGVSRRRLIGASAAGLGAACIASAAGNARPASAADAAARPATRHPADLADTVFAAFRRHRLVAIGEFHGLQEHHDALVTLLTDHRLPELVDDVVVEFGNSLYQDLVDRFISGLPTENADLHPVWRNTTNSPLATGDEPIYEDFFRVMRAANWRLPAGQRIRLLLGDPPIDWPKITTPGQVSALRNQRDTFAASLVEREVLSKGRGALICYGSGHVMHHADTADKPPPGAPSAIVPLIEQRTGQRVFSLVTLAPLAGDPGGMAERLAPYPRGVVIPAAGTWLGTFNAGDSFPPSHPGPRGSRSTSTAACPSAHSPTAGSISARPTISRCRARTRPSTWTRRTGRSFTGATRCKAA